MAASAPPPDASFLAKLRNRLADLRLRTDLGEITTLAEFRHALDAGGAFALEDPRVRAQCVAAGFAHWIA